jgi:hypothetical protein
MLYTFVGDAPPTGPDGWRVEAPILRGTAVINFPESCAPGTKVWFAAQ